MFALFSPSSWPVVCLIDETRRLFLVRIQLGPIPPCLHTGYFQTSRDTHSLSENGEDRSGTSWSWCLARKLFHWIWIRAQLWKGCCRVGRGECWVGKTSWAVPTARVARRTAGCVWELSAGIPEQAAFLRFAVSWVKVQDQIFENVWETNIRPGADPAWKWDGALNCCF